MADDNLVLEHLRAIRQDIKAIRDTQDEHGYRLNRIEQAIAGMRRDQAGDAENVAHHSVRLDQLMSRIERIEHRLESSEP